MIRRLAHLIWGAEVDRALRPVLLVTLMGSLAGSSAWNFMGIWAVKELGATSTQLSYGYLLMAVVAGFVGYGAGHLSDHFGRRRLILIGEGILAVYVLLFLGVGHHIWFGLGLMVGAAGLGSFGGSAGQAMVADLVPPNHVSEFVHRAERVLPRAIRLMRSEKRNRGVAPVVDFAWRSVLGVELKHRKQFHRRDPEILEIRNSLDQAGVGAARLLIHAGTGMASEAAHVHLVDYGARGRQAQRSIALPIVRAWIDDHALHRRCTRVARPLRSSRS